MALNWTMLDQKRLPVPLPDEINILTINDGAEVILTIPNSGGPKRLKETGRIHLTDHRVRIKYHRNNVKSSLQGRIIY